MIKAKLYNIVVADNNPVVIQGLVTLFKETQNFQVKGISNNGADLRNLLENNQDFNTLIIDLKLPKTNIHRLLKDLIVVYDHLKIITFTSFAMPKLVQDIMEIGVHSYLSKNATLPEILEAIERVHKGEYFIGSSVYYKDDEPDIDDNNFILDEADNFVKFAELTERELDVIVLITRGLTNKEIASKLYLSKYTVETHRKNIMKKFKLKTVGQLVYYATQRGIV